MPRHSFGALATGAGSTTLPMISLYSSASVGPTIREVAVYNTTTTQVDIALRVATTAGTQGASIDEMQWSQNKAAPSATAVQAHSSTPPTITAGFIRRILLPGVIGAGVIWTFGDQGYELPEGTGNGICVIPGAGTGQLCVVEMVWDE